LKPHNRLQIRLSHQNFTTCTQTSSGWR